MSSEQVERLSNRQFVRREIRRISQASTTEEKIALEEGLENYIVDKLNQLEASQQENERLRHGITAIIEGDKGDEPLETADQVVSLLEGLLAALEEQEFKDSAS